MGHRSCRAISRETAEQIVPATVARRGSIVVGSSVERGFDFGILKRFQTEVFQSIALSRVRYLLLFGIYIILFTRKV